jgi:prepilin peptidase CpaA
MSSLTASAQLAVLLPALALAAVLDWRSRRVPNALVAPIALAGVVTQAIDLGLRGLGLAVGGALFGAACTLPFYLLRGMAAGDVKLMAAAGAWFAPVSAPWLVASSFLVGGGLGVALTLAGRRRHGVPYAVAIALGTGATLLLVHAR